MHATVVLSLALLAPASTACANNVAPDRPDDYTFSVEDGAGFRP